MGAAQSPLERGQLPLQGFDFQALGLGIKALVTHDRVEFLFLGLDLLLERANSLEQVLDQIRQTAVINVLVFLGGGGTGLAQLRQADAQTIAQCLIILLDALGARAFAPQRQSQSANHRCRLHAHNRTHLQMP